MRIPKAFLAPPTLRAARGGGDGFESALGGPENHIQPSLGDSVGFEVRLLYTVDCSLPHFLVGQDLRRLFRAVAGSSSDLSSPSMWSL